MSESANFFKFSGIILKTTYAVIVLNLLFWLAIALLYNFVWYPGEDGQLAVKILLFLEPVCFGLVLLGLWKKIRIIFYSSFVFLIANSILSLSDEVGVLDIISLILNFALFLLLFGYQIKK